MKLGWTFICPTLCHSILVYLDFGFWLSRKSCLIFLIIIGMCSDIVVKPSALLSMFVPPQLWVSRSAANKIRSVQGVMKLRILAVSVSVRDICRDSVTLQWFTNYLSWAQYFLATQELAGTCSDTSKISMNWGNNGDRINLAATGHARWKCICGRGGWEKWPNANWKPHVIGERLLVSSPLIDRTYICRVHRRRRSALTQPSCVCRKPTMLNPVMFSIWATKMTKPEVDKTWNSLGLHSQRH